MLAKRLIQVLTSLQSIFSPQPSTGPNTSPWLYRPIIQYPQDIVSFQEVVSQVKPDSIMKSGIAYGDSLVLCASMLCLLDVMEGLDPRLSSRKIVGVDIDIRPHIRKVLDKHPLRF
jgi:cephalosporin hydroxylase